MIFSHSDNILTENQSQKSHQFVSLNVDRMYVFMIDWIENKTNVMCKIRIFLCLRENKKPRSRESRVLHVVFQSDLNRSVCDCGDEEYVIFFDFIFHGNRLLSIGLGGCEFSVSLCTAFFVSGHGDMFFCGA